MKKAIVLVLILAYIVGCKEEKGFIINGNIKDYDNMNVYFDRIKGDGAMEMLTKAKTGSNGSLQIKLPAIPSAGIYRVRVGANSIDLILDGKSKKVSIDADLKKIGNYGYSVDGAPLTETYLNDMRQHTANATVTSDITKRLGGYDPMVSLAILNKVYKSDLSVAPVNQDVLNKLKSKYPDSYITKQYEPIVAQKMMAYNKMMAQRKVAPGQIAPEIALPDLNGNIQKLSDLRGKLVLLDFWASWCGPCRKANPKIVEVYNKYRKKGFTVYSVSLDGAGLRPGQQLDEATIKSLKQRGKERWAAAIKKDKLTWKHHVSVLQKWNCPAASEYGVSSIPRAFLIDRDGKIIANNVRYDLEALVKSNI